MSKVCERRDKDVQALALLIFLQEAIQEKIDAGLIQTFDKQQGRRTQLSKNLPNSVNGTLVSVVKARPFSGQFQTDRSACADNFGPFGPPNLLSSETLEVGQALGSCISLNCFCHVSVVPCSCQIQVTLQTVVVLSWLQLGHQPRGHQSGPKVNLLAKENGSKEGGA